MRDDGPGVRLLARPMRVMLLVASVLGTIAFLQLFVGTEATDRYFAWTIQPPLTAAFLGATYGASVVLLFLSSRRRTWAEARIGVLGGIVLTTLVLVAILIHDDRFHLYSDSAVTFAGTWAFVGTYFVLPPLLLLAAVLQTRAGGRDPARTSPLPRWFRLLLTVEAAAMLGVGGALVLVPERADVLWPWMLTALTGRAVGAFVFSSGLAAALAVWENDWRRIDAAVTSYGALGFLELVALLRYPREPDWGSASAWVYLVFLLTMPAIGAYGWYRARQRDAATRPAPAAAGP